MRRQAVGLVRRFLDDRASGLTHPGDRGVNVLTVHIGTVTYAVLPPATPDIGWVC